MNVLIATYLSPSSPSGVVTYTRTLAGDLAGEGLGVHTVDSSCTPVVWRKCLGVLKRVMRPLGGAFAAFYDEFAYFTGLYLSVRKLKHLRFDVIHAQDVRSGVAAYLALNKRVPIVLTCHFNDDPVHELVALFSLKPGFAKQLTNWYTYLFSYVRNYVFVSDYAYTKSKHLLPALINKQILRNTVRLEAPVAPTRNDKLSSDPVIISNVGYIDERKNQQLLIQIGSALRKRGIHNFRLWFIGDGPKREEYTQLASQLDLIDHVTFYGQQPTPWKLVAKSDLYVHTSLNDNCPYSIVEAFAVGTPVLALPVGGVPEMLPDGFGALRGTTTDELTDEVAHYLESEPRQQLAAAQAAKAALYFNHQINLEKLLLFYRESIGESVPVVAQPVPVSC